MSPVTDILVTKLTTRRSSGAPEHPGRGGRPWGPWGPRVIGHAGVVGDLGPEDLDEGGSVWGRDGVHAQADLQEGEPQRPQVARHRVLRALRAQRENRVMRIWLADTVGCA